MFRSVDRNQWGGGVAVDGGVSVGQRIVMIHGKGNHERKTLGIDFKLLPISLIFKIKWLFSM